MEDNYEGSISMGLGGDQYDDASNWGKKEKREKEICLICKKETHVYKDTDIEMRDYYIYGVGQLCQDCYFDLYENRKRGHEE